MVQILQTLPKWTQLTLTIVPAISTMLAALGLLLTFLQSLRNNAQARATLVASCLKDFANDEAMQRSFYAIEYSKFKYNDDFHDSEQEQDIDKLLRHFANLALAWQSKLLNIEDVSPVQYYVLRITRNAEVQKYLNFIAQWSKNMELGEHPYAVLSSMSEKLEKYCR